MTVEQDTGYILLTGTANLKLAQDIATHLKTSIYNPIKGRFADGEADVQIPVNVRGQKVFVIQPTCPPNVADNILDLRFIIYAAYLASAREITAVIPYFGYSRQDRKNQPRVPISAALISRDIQSAEADRILTVDIHSEQTAGYVTIPWDNVYASWSLVPHINSLKLDRLVVASPDKGGVPRATAYARRLGAESVAIVYKERDISRTNYSETMSMIGDVEGRNVLLVDDILDTAGTLVNAARLLKERGAKSIRAAITHGLFTNNAVGRIEQSDIEKVFITDTVPTRDEVQVSPKIEVVSISQMLAGVIQRIHTGESISEKYIQDG